MKPSELPNIQIRDLDLIHHRYDAYAPLRAAGPFYDDEWRLVFFPGYNDVDALLRDERFGRDIRHLADRSEVDTVVFDRNYPTDAPVWTRLVRGAFLDVEPPEHTRLRKLVQGQFTVRNAEQQRADLQTLSDDIVRRAVADGGMDVVADLASAIPVAAIARLLGIGEQDEAMLVEWSHAVVRLFDLDCTPDEATDAESAITAFAEYFTEAAATKRRNPQDDLLSDLAARDLDEDDLASTATLVLMAGHEATVHAIGNMVLALDQNPDQFAALKSDPTLTRSAVEEALRYDTPLHLFERWALEDVVWNDIEIPRGTKVGLLLGSANRDDAMFPDGASFDITRSPNAHVSFGRKVHHCVGAQLARVEMDVALRSLVRYVDSIEVAHDKVEPIPSTVFRGHLSIPVELRGSARTP